MKIKKPLARNLAMMILMVAFIALMITSTQAKGGGRSGGGRGGSRSGGGKGGGRGGGGKGRSAGGAVIVGGAAGAAGGAAVAGGGRGFSGRNSTSAAVTWVAASKVGFIGRLPLILVILLVII